MEIINKKHRSITSNQRVELGAYFKLADEKMIYFSAGAVLQWGLIPGLHIHFVNNDDRWFFYANADKDGFRLVGRVGKNATVICDASLVKLITKRTGVSLGSSFRIVQLEAKHNNNTLFEIEFNTPVDIWAKSKENHKKKRRLA